MSLDLTTLVKGTTIVHLPSGTGHILRNRKADRSGWWLLDGGGVSDEALTSGSWATTDDLVVELRNANGAIATRGCAAPRRAGRRPWRRRRLRLLLDAVPVPHGRRAPGCVMTVPTRLVIVGELLWRAKRVVDCMLALTPWRWIP